MRSVERALQVLAHEAVGHYGMEAITGPQVWNIRELIGVVERHLINSEDTIVRVEDLDAHLCRPVNDNCRPFMTIAQLEDEHHKAKMKHILNTIDSSGTKVEAARRLGIKPNHLQYLLNESKAAKASEAHQ